MGEPVPSQTLTPFASSTVTVHSADFPPAVAVTVEEASNEEITLTDADYPTTPLVAGTYSNNFSSIGFRIVAVTGSSSAFTGNDKQIDVYPGDYLTFYVDKACTFSTTIGNKGCKLVKSDGKVITDMGSSTGSLSESLAAGKYYITTGTGATGYTRIKTSITVEYTE